MLACLSRTLLVALLAWPLAHAADTAPSKSSTGTPGQGARAADPLANLKAYEERRYRIDMQDCAKQKGADRRVCERTVHRRAAAKSRRRGESGY